MRVKRHVGRPSWTLAGLLLASLPLDAEAPRVVLTAVNSRVLVAEPVVLDARFFGVQEFWLQPLGAKSKHLRLLIDRGSGFQLYAPLRFVSEDYESPIKPEGGRYRMEFILIWDRLLDDWAFPRAGDYQVVLEYRDDVVGKLRSNDVRLSVAAPEGNEAVVFGKLRAFRDALVVRAFPVPLAELEPLAREFPSSAYLQVARISDLSSRFHHALQGCEAPFRCATGKEEMERKSRDLMRALLPDAESLASLDSPFQPEALLFRARILGGLGQDAAQQDLLRRIVSEHGQRLAADRAKLSMTSPE